MKKIIAIILSIAMLLAVAACGKKTKDTGSSAEYIPQGDKLLLPAAADVYDGEQKVGSYTYEWSDIGCILTVTEGEPLSGGVLSAKYDGNKLEFYDESGNSIGMYYSFDEEGYLTLEGFDNGNNEYVITYTENRNELTFVDTKVENSIPFAVKNTPEQRIVTVDALSGDALNHQKYTYSQYGDVIDMLRMDLVKGEYVSSGSTYDYKYDSVGNMLEMKRTSSERVVTAKYTLSEIPQTHAWQSAVIDLIISETYGLDPMYYLISPMIKLK